MEETLGALPFRELGEAAAAGAILILRFRKGDFPACTTRIVRSERGLPWDKQIAIHALHSSGMEMKAVTADPGPNG